MDRYRNVLWVVIVCTMLYSFSCVTINIYFPAEEVESVAEGIVDDVRGHKSDEKGKSPGDKNSFFLKKAILALLPGVAWAQGETSVSNPTIRALKEKMKARYGQIKPHYQKGRLKEQNNGYVSIGNTAGLGLKGKRDLKTLVDAENNDRERMYEEVAKALKINPSQISRVAEIFAKQWQASVR